MDDLPSSACSFCQKTLLTVTPPLGKMNQIPLCDWLPERQAGAILLAPDYPLLPARKWRLLCCAIKQLFTSLFGEDGCKLTSFFYCSSFWSLLDVDCVLVNRHAPVVTSLATSLATPTPSKVGHDKKILAF